MGKSAAKPNPTKCGYCGKKCHIAGLGIAGDHVGKPRTLGRRIMKNSYSSFGKSASYHPLSFRRDPISLKKIKAGSKKFDIAQAHHLICSESMDNEPWAKICSNHGYDINCVENGVFLPSDMRVACQYELPLHRGNHDATETDETPDYLSFVNELIDPIKKNIKDYCPPENTDPKKIINELNDISKDIWELIDGWGIFLTSDGSHYMSGGEGCCGFTNIPDKDDADVTTLGIGKRMLCERKHPPLPKYTHVFKER